MKFDRLIILLIFLLIAFSPYSHADNFTIPDWVQKSCVFIMDGEKAQGTGFLIWLKEQDRTFCYLVTAKHVVQPILNKPNAPLSIRFNLKEKGKAEIITFPTFLFNGMRWIEHSNPAVDLAVLPLTIFDKIQNLEVSGKPVTEPSDDFFATADWITKYKVGIGDNVFTLGLVPYLFDKNQINLVLARFGKVSLLPQDEITLPDGKQRVYFIDSPAFGGNSGGPVFILIERNERGPLLSGWRFALLGIVTQFVPSPLRMSELSLQDTAGQKAIQLIENTGLTKVVPVDYLSELLFSDAQKSFRKNIVDNQKKSIKE